MHPPGSECILHGSECILYWSECILQEFRVHPTWVRVHPTWVRVHPTWVRVHPTWVRVHPTWVRVHPTWVRVHPTWVRVHPTWVRVHPPWVHFDQCLLGEKVGAGASPPTWIRSCAPDFDTRSTRASVCAAPASQQVRSPHKKRFVKWTGRLINRGGGVGSGRALSLGCTTH